jgi:hypothetical protein
MVSALAPPAPTSKVRKLVNAAINSSALRTNGVADGIFETEVVDVELRSFNGALVTDDDSKILLEST